MKNTRLLLITALLGLGFTTGFTCSKNAPTETTTEVAPPAPAPEVAPTEQEQMGTTATETAPPAEVPAPTEAAPAQGETK
ncbi:MAG: acylneuraminate cytidylyltransferase [Pseudobdellovibrionaceae bacterium]